MSLSELRQKYIEFFVKHGHTQIPSSSLVPENDPTTLLTGSGMQPLLPYLLGKDHPEGSRLVDSQKCFRAEDIEEVGDNRHTTFFEMLGNWSLGDYFKDDQIPWVAEFLIDTLGLDPNKLYVTCFAGNEQFSLPKDEQSAKLWQDIFEKKGIAAEIVEIGSEADGYQKGMQNGRIFYYDSAKNWWSRSGKPENMPVGEPGGQSNEYFYDFGTEHDTSFGPHCHPNCDCGRFVEIGNSVFMQYIKSSESEFTELPKKNVDFGGGLERMAMALTGSNDVFEVKELKRLIEILERHSGKSYQDKDAKRSMRIVVDHARGAAFMLLDGIRPSNKDRGYVLRRILRRAYYHLSKLGLDHEAFVYLYPVIVEMYKDHYTEFENVSKESIVEILAEGQKFEQTLNRGLNEFARITTAEGKVSGKAALMLFTTYGLPIDMLKELAEEKGLELDEKGFEEEFKGHQEASKADGKKFKGGLADTSAKTTALHTTTHLMLAALRKYLGDHVHQAGSNITEERTRFDFTHPEKVSDEVLRKVEDYVNEAISKKAKVSVIQMPKEEAKAQGVEGSFWEKYPDTVDVYQVSDEDGNVYSKELCGGPHVENTGNIAGTFKIVKEESSSSGVRRIKAVLE
ncbi:MAG: alanine--tRNA ligase [Candidatus Paceibacterota bacterium]